MKTAENFDSFLKFKEDNNLLYQKIRDILYNFKDNSIIYFDQIDVLVKNILNHYNLIERQILVRNLLFEIDPGLVKYYEIFPQNNILDLNLKRKKYKKNQDFIYFYPEKTIFDILNQIKRSEGSFKLFE